MKKLITNTICLFFMILLYWGIMLLVESRFREKIHNLEDRIDELESTQVILLQDYKVRLEQENNEI